MSAVPEFPYSMPASLRPVRALFFDMVGTTLFWLDPVVRTLESVGARTPALSSRQPPVDWASFAFAWRSSLFTVYSELAEASSKDPAFTNTPLQQEAVCLRGLELACERYGLKDVWSGDELQEICEAWFRLEVWPDTKLGLDILKTRYTCVGLANGSLAYLSRVHKRNGVWYDLLLTQDLVRAYKPNPEAYLKATSLVGLEPAECAMVASHAYDLEAAQRIGMRTIYIDRSTEDGGVDLSQYSFDLSVGEGGFVEVARRLGLDG